MRRQDDEGFKAPGEGRMLRIEAAVRERPLAPAEVAELEAAAGAERQAIAALEADAEYYAGSMDGAIVQANLEAARRCLATRERVLAMALAEAGPREP